MLVSVSRVAGAKPIGDGPLILARLFIVIMMLGSFALGFAELIRQSEALSTRPQSAASTCGDAVGTPCPSQRAL